MKILVVSTHDSRGGAGKAAYRFAKEFINQGHEVCLYVRDKSENDSFIVESPYPHFISKLLHALDFLPGYILSGFDKDANFTLGLFGENLDPVIKSFKPDVISVHWSWKGFVSFTHIAKISRKVPVVWTMHDFSPFSGGIFNPSIEKNTFIKLLGKINNLVRRSFLNGSNITFVSPSEFLLKEFKKTNFSHGENSAVINNGVDLNIFKKSSKEEVRKGLGLDLNKKYILFGALNFVENRIKGGYILKKVLLDLEQYLMANSIGLISFGSQNPFDFLHLDNRIETRFAGFIKSDIEMANLLSSADLMLVPSKCENYPFAVLESLCCSTPVAAFNVGGIPEMIISSENGFLAKPFDEKEFEDGVKTILNNHIQVENPQTFDIKIHAKEYVDLFRGLIR